MKGTQHFLDRMRAVKATKGSTLFKLDVEDFYMTGMHGHLAHNAT